MLATGPDGRRIAWEVQVSSIGEDTAAERTRRLAASGVEVCWLPTVNRSTLAGLPRARVAETVEGWCAVEHVAAYGGRIRGTALGRGGWHVPERLALGSFAAGVCRGSVVWSPKTTGGVWTTAAHLAAAAAADASHAAWVERQRRRHEAHPVVRELQRRAASRFDHRSGGDDRDRVRALIAWQRRVRRGWDAPDSRPPW